MFRNLHHNIVGSEEYERSHPIIAGKYHQFVLSVKLGDRRYLTR